MNLKHANSRTDRRRRRRFQEAKKALVIKVLTKVITSEISAELGQQMLKQAESATQFNELYEASYFPIKTNMIQGFAPNVILFDEWETRRYEETI